MAMVLRVKPGWRAFWFGSERTGQALAAAGILATTGLMLLGLFVDFIPAAGLYGAQMTIAFGFIGLCLTAVLLGAMVVKGAFSIAMARMGWKGWMAIAFMPALFGIIAWIVFVKALPWVFTRVFGEEHEIRAVMRTDYVRSRRWCDHRLKGGPFEATMPSFTCISRRYYARYPDQDVTVRLEGKRSGLGFAVTSVHHVSDSDGVPAD